MMSSSVSAVLAGEVRRPLGVFQRVGLVTLSRP